jgi:hypothetical protein
MQFSPSGEAVVRRGSSVGNDQGTGGAQQVGSGRDDGLEGYGERVSRLARGHTFARRGSGQL